MANIHIVVAQVLSTFHSPSTSNDRCYHSPLSSLDHAPQIPDAEARAAWIHRQMPPPPVFFLGMMHASLSMNQPPPSQPLRLLCKKIVPDAKLPARMSPESIGLDVFACEDATIDTSGRPVLVPTGVAMKPDGPFFAKIESRSSLARRGVIVVGGIIDPDFTGQVIVMLANLTSSVYCLRKGDRIAQLVCLPYTLPSPAVVHELPATERGSGAFGSTGK